MTRTSRRREAHALGCLVREAVTRPSNYRAGEDFAGVDEETRADRDCGARYAGADPAGAREGPPTIAIAHRADGVFDLEALRELAAEWPGLEGMDLAQGGQPAAGRAVVRAGNGLGRGV